MGGGAGGKYPLALHCPVDFDGWYFIFLRDRVRQHGDIPTMKKVKYPIIDVAKRGSQFINTIAQQISFGPPQFVAQLDQAANANHALGIRLRTPRPQIFSHSHTGAEPSASRKKSSLVCGIR